MRFEQRGADRGTKRCDVRFGLQASDLERDPPRQRIAVGVKARRRKADEDVAIADGPSVHEPIPGHCANNETRDVVLPVGIEAWHLRGFPAKKRAAVRPARGREPLDHLDGDVRIEPAGGEVVQEEKGLRSLNEDVVHAVIDEVDPDRGVYAGHERDAQLRPDAIGAGNENHIAQVGTAQREQPAE